MLESLYLATINNNNLYNNQVFGEHYTQQLNNHGCHVHVVGKIFEIAGLVHQINAQNYQIH